MSNLQPKIIKGLRSLEDYFREINVPMSRPLIMKYIKHGMPCWYEFGTYHFHVENIEDFFKAMTSEPTREYKEEIDNGGG